MTITLGDLRKESAGLPDETPIIINSAFEKLYLHSCIGSKTGDVDHKGPYLELMVFEEETGNE